MRFILALVFVAGPGALAFSSPLTRCRLRILNTHRLVRLEGAKRSSDVADNEVVYSRKTFLENTAWSLAASAAMVVERPESAQASEDGMVDVYFGCGCFWHVQHEFVEAEMKILGRSDQEISARAGYAGGKAGSVDGKVCYHNAASIADYGKLGHAEIVSLKVPEDKIEDFAVEYFKLFDKEGFRPDQFGDKGSEYRNIIGIPGGARGEFSQKLVKASLASGDKLDFAVGKGDDRDVPKVVFVMDSTAYPSFVAEQYHQFHDGFNWGENYPDSYNKMAINFAKRGESFGKCPNGALGVGLGGL